ncbi:nitroreductase family deazaflavin-dependent oxidoreductase [Microlunatus elymi]|uniref:Nitroreductase family deazaflavin-dependent oxidoreductase n=1 Tax=Microlunatus elymi TaxID=2596828 RepID=A0A516PXD8_9ACTN|nr:nitroreductase family deazaflavin-dependent oxidoreductase [Microlunatus elymi]QDP95812.1 nitroreductase family deazaflavin-dependent oxidoreductase [Microlunatus elymi]
MPTSGSSSSARLSARIGARILRTRAVVRAPIWLYRAGFGFVFGRRLLLLEHIGRRSGVARYVVLEVDGRSTRGGYVVASGFGTRAQWYRNLIKQPEVRIQIGWSGWLPARARQLPDDEAAAVLDRYAEQHPTAWQQLRPIFSETLGADIEVGGTSLPMIALEPR